MNSNPAVLFLLFRSLGNGHRKRRRPPRRRHRKKRNTITTTRKTITWSRRRRALRAHARDDTLNSARRKKKSIDGTFSLPAGVLRASPGGRRSIPTRPFRIPIPPRRGESTRAAGECVRACRGAGGGSHVRFRPPLDAAAASPVALPLQPIVVARPPATAAYTTIIIISLLLLLHVLRSVYRR